MAAMDWVRNKSRSGNYKSGSVIMHSKYPERELSGKCRLRKAKHYCSGIISIALGFDGEQRGQPPAVHTHPGLTHPLVLPIERQMPLQRNRSLSGVLAISAESLERNAVVGERSAFSTAEG